MEQGILWTSKSIGKLNQLLISTSADPYLIKTKAY